jgi:PIN domain nuclease of toxin-antitoxin system
MKALLDTHTFIWWNQNAPELSPRARAFMADVENEIYLSAVSAWEIAIKYARGRLTLPEPPDQYIAQRIIYHRFTPLSIEMRHAVQVYDLPDIHRDPFDRLLVVQSKSEKLPLLTADITLAQYEIEIIW